MPRIKKEIEVKAEIAAEKAKKDVYKESRKRKKKERKQKEYKSSLGPSQTRWIKDPLGKQGDVFFDGYRYWLTTISPKSKGETIRKVFRIGLTPEKWEERIENGGKKNGLET